MGDPTTPGRLEAVANIGPEPAPEEEVGPPDTEICCVCGLPVPDDDLDEGWLEDGTRIVKHTDCGC